MTDSCRPRKLDPGLAHTYSNPSVLSTSTMKSEPVRSAVRISTLEGVPTSASGDIASGIARRSSAGCAATVPGTAAKAAAPAAALFRKFRRSTSTFLGLVIAFHLGALPLLHVISHGQT